MISSLKIRECQPRDIKGIEQLYGDVFPDEDLFPLVKKLLNLKQEAISLVGILENIIVGHISFTCCHVEGEKHKVALLGPLAVKPTFQKQGIGKKLVQTGLRHLENSRTGYVFVLGDPAYYSRLGFKTEQKVVTPYPILSEWMGAWQSIKLCSLETVLEGKLVVPEPWCQVSLWTP